MVLLGSSRLVGGKTFNKEFMGQAGNGLARRGSAWHGEERPGIARRGQAGQGVAEQGMARQGFFIFKIEEQAV